MSWWFTEIGSPSYFYHFWKEHALLYIFSLQMLLTRLWTVLFHLKMSCLYVLTLCKWVKGDNSTNCGLFNYNLTDVNWIDTYYNQTFELSINVFTKKIEKLKGLSTTFCVRNSVVSLRIEPLRNCFFHH